MRNCTKMIQNSGASYFGILVLICLLTPVTLFAQNQAPVAVDDAPGPVREDIGPTAFSYDVFLANDTDPNNDNLEIIAFDFSTFPGTITDNRSNRTIEFVTAVNFNGQINIPYTISDGQLTSSAIITLTIIETADDLQIGQDGPFATDANVPVSIAKADLLSNDTSIPYLGNSPVELVINSVGSAVNGTVEIVGDVVVFTPGNNFVGQASFTYDIQVLNDGFGPPRPVNEGTSTPVLIDVTGVVPTPPSINGTFVFVSKADPALYLQVDGTANRTSAVMEGCDDGLFWEITDRGNGFHKIRSVFADKALESYAPVHGSDVTIYASNNRDWQQWEFIDNGDGYFKIRGKFDTRFLTLNRTNAIMSTENSFDSQLWSLIDINGFVCNDKPVANDEIYTISVFDMLYLPFSELLANDIDPDGDLLTISEITGERLGDATIIGDSIRFIPSSPGPALFTYLVSDGRGGTDEGLVFVDVVFNLPPVAVDDGFFEIREDIGLTGIRYSTLLNNDSDPDGDQLSVIGFDFTGFPGTIEDRPQDEEILFTTAQDFSGQITFTYTISDGNSTATANVVLNIINLLDPPTVVSDGPFEIQKNETLSIAIADLLANDFDPDGDVVSFQSVSNPVNGNVSVTGNQVLFTPNSGFAGQASFQYTVVSGISFPMTATSEAIIVNVLDGPVSLNGTFVISSALNNAQFLQVNDTDNRSRVFVDSCNIGTKWQITDLGNGFHKIENLLAGKALESYNPIHGNDVTIFTANNKDWQQWEITDGGNGSFQVKGKFNPLYLTEINGEAKMAAANGSDSQRWILEDATVSNCASTSARIESRSVSVIEDQTFDQNGISIFPNPTIDYITVNMKLEEPVQYELVNGFGQSVLKGELTSEDKSIDIRELSNGIYFLRMEKVNQFFGVIKQ
ncbi:MAG: cadherin-like domain-containing protein [Bacteroidota bacterium]